MKIIVLGAGVQGTLYAVRLARAGHEVTLVARGGRAAELRRCGAVIREALTDRTDTLPLPVIERVTPETAADLCFVTVRREQLADALPDLIAAPGIARVVILVNHANGSEWLDLALGRQRVVLGFPGAAGAIIDGVDRYVDVKEQPTTIASDASDIAALLRSAGFRVTQVRDMDSWLRRHAVFVTAIAGALYQVDGDAHRLASDASRMRALIRAIREGWRSLDRRGVAPPPLALRAIFCWVPLPLAVMYWRRLLRSARGELYFALHARHAPGEMAALAADVRPLLERDTAPQLTQLYDAIDAAAAQARRAAV